MGMTLRHYEQTVMDNINEQPSVLRTVLDQRSIYCDPFVRALVDNGIRKVIFLGSGTSYNVSCIAEYYFKHLIGMDAAAYLPTVFKNYEKPDWSGFIPSDRILCVGISQSGTSVSTCEAMQFAHSQGCKTLAITGDLSSEITKHVDTTAHLLVGREITPPETKGYTTSVLSVFLWALSVAHELGRISDEGRDGYLVEANKLVDAFDATLDESNAWYDRNKVSLLNSERIYVLGYGIDHGSMLEGILKVGEMARVSTIGYEMEEYAHGPTMAIKPNQSILLFGTEGAEFARMLQSREAFKKFTDRVHVVTCEQLPSADERDVMFSTHVGMYLAPIMHTVPMQILAARGAEDTYIDVNVDPFGGALAHYRPGEV